MTTLVNLTLLISSLGWVGATDTARSLLLAGRNLDVLRSFALPGCKLDTALLGVVLLEAAEGKIDHRSPHAGRYIDRSLGHGLECHIRLNHRIDGLLEAAADRNRHVADHTVIDRARSLAAADDKLHLEVQNLLVVLQEGPGAAGGSAAGDEIAVAWERCSRQCASHIRRKECDSVSAKCLSEAGKMLEALGPGMVQSTGCGCIRSSGLPEACRVRLGSCLPLIQVAPDHHCLNDPTVRAIHLVRRVILLSWIRPRMTEQDHQGRSSCHAVDSSRRVKMIRPGKTVLCHQVQRTDSSACRCSASSSREIPSHVRQHFFFLHHTRCVHIRPSSCPLPVHPFPSCPPIQAVRMDSGPQACHRASVLRVRS